jgi:hypothetical protein
MSFIKKLLNELDIPDALLGKSGNPPSEGLAPAVRRALVYRFGVPTGRIGRKVARETRAPRRPSGQSRKSDRPSGSSRPKATTPPPTTPPRRRRRSRSRSETEEYAAQPSKIEGHYIAGPPGSPGAEALRRAAMEAQKKKNEAYKNLAFIFLDVINEASVDIGKHPELLKQALEGPDDPTPKKSLLARLVSRFFPKRKPLKTQEK